MTRKGITRASKSVRLPCDPRPRSSSWSTVTMNSHARGSPSLRPGRGLTVAAIMIPARLGHRVPSGFGVSPMASRANEAVVAPSAPSELGAPAASCLLKQLDTQRRADSTIKHTRWQPGCPHPVHTVCKESVDACKRLSSQHSCGSRASVRRVLPESGGASVYLQLRMLSVDLRVT